MTMNLRTSLLFFLLLIITGCASAPRQELQSARGAVARAYAEQAPHYAPREYQAAKIALEDGESLFHRGDYELAAKALVYAKAHGRQAASEARREKTRIEQERLQYYQELIRLEPPAPVAEPAEPEEKPQREKVSPPPPPPPPPPPQTKKNTQSPPIP